MVMNTNFARIENIVKELSNLPEAQRSAILKLNFNELKGLEGEELRQRLSKTSFGEVMSGFAL